MAWPSRNNQVDYSSLPQLHGVGNEDSTFYKETSATQAPFVTAAEPLSTEYGFYNPRVSLGAALLHPNSALPSTIAPFNLEYMDQGAMQGLPVQWNGTIEGPATNHHPLVENTVGVEALYSASTVQQPSPPKDSGIPTTRGHRARGRPAKKQEDRYGSFECQWIDCKHRGAFSCESVLMRHIRTQHVNPGSIECPSCKKTFNRKDNMKEHLGRVHREYI